ncbi:hypothetical protein NC653_036084 [Populus alba x Populus x berolinensis]|uniref:Uncharacterized protein n=2 Tax=Populus TaxID=3689 RepID=A0A4U5NKP6_POPAL|nr:uncharacterized protein LOC118051298 [Populus alba]KAJ6968035.1 hypothetical protein NC653_036084 [Populus alba x Populus x berolinensis]TKR84157.1 hypothetical protein D5086_0000261900 [Populus alba]
MQSCTKVAVDFVSPENIRECLRLTEEFRQLPVNHRARGQTRANLTRSILNGGASSDDHGSIEAVEAATPDVVDGVFCGKRITVLPPVTASAVAGLVSGVEVTAKTRLPVRSKAMVSFRWGVRVPAEIKSGGESTAGINFRTIPVFVMNKIGIEHVDGRDERSKKAGATGKVEMDSGNAEVAEACLGVKRQLEVLQGENGHLRKAVEELSEEIGGGKLLVGDLDSGKYERNGIKSPE